jgi:crotonobetainyl-CoA:carnitine CoA-transferase CaiB-like acyl-CoA transferase
MSLAEVFDDPQVQAQDMAVDIDHPGHGPVRVTGFPVKMTGTPCEVRFPAPNLGAHGAEILEELGYSAEKIAATLSAATPTN